MQKSLYWSELLSKHQRFWSLKSQKVIDLEKLCRRKSFIFLIRLQTSLFHRNRTKIQKSWGPPFSELLVIFDNFARLNGQINLTWCTQISLHNPPKPWSANLTQVLFFLNNFDIPKLWCAIPALKLQNLNWFSEFRSPNIVGGKNFRIGTNL